MSDFGVRLSMTFSELNSFMVVRLFLHDGCTFGIVACSTPLCLTEGFFPGRAQLVRQGAQLFILLRRASVWFCNYFNLGPSSTYRDTVSE